MRPISIISLMIFLLISFIFLYPMPAKAQYPRFNPFWTFQQAPFLPVFPLWSMEPVFLNPMFPGTPLAMPLFSSPISSPLLVEPMLRRGNAPVTLTVPTVTITTAPLTAILGLINPNLLASNIATLTSIVNPTVFNLLVTTFQLPFLGII